jgi:hypothetical protein
MRRRRRRRRRRPRGSLAARARAFGCAWQESSQDKFGQGPQSLGRPAPAVSTRVAPFGVVVLSLTRLPRRRDGPPAEPPDDCNAAQAFRRTAIHCASATAPCQSKHKPAAQGLRYKLCWGPSTPPGILWACNAFMLFLFSFLFPFLSTPNCKHCQHVLTTLLILAVAPTPADSAPDCLGGH